MAQIVYLNGTFLPESEASVPVLDRGFIFGDGVYEVIPVFAGRTFRLAGHLQRLENSLAAIRLDNPFSADEWARLFNELIERNGAGDQSLYLQVTRGQAVRDHAFPVATKATVFAMSNPLKPIAPELLAGVSAITLDDIRWQYCHIKAISLLPNILMRQQAVEAGAQEAILVREGEVTEGAASNIFVVKDGLLRTPPTGPFLLPGITRDLILELAAANAIPYQEGRVTPQELKQADEIWLTSSTKEILPVTSLDGEPVGTGSPGTLWRAVWTLYQEYKTTLSRGEGAG